jgi:hypothetical protein
MTKKHKYAVTQRIFTDEKLPIRFEVFSANGERVPLKFVSKPIWKVLRGKVTLDIAKDGKSGHIIAPDVTDSSIVFVNAECRLFDQVILKADSCIRIITKRREKKL